MKLKERLISLSGEDYRIVKHCDAGSQTVFLIAGLFIPVVFVISLASSFITFRQVFDSPYAAIFLSLFFAWMITNLYRLLLYTFSRNALPRVNKKSGILFSRVLRIGFLCFIATMISKPIESLLYADLLDLDIAIYKLRAKKDSHYNIVLHYQRQIDEIMSLSADEVFTQKFLQDKLLGRRQSILHANALINSSGFFLQRLRILCIKHRSCWWVTAFFLLVFLYPLALKYHLRKSLYYELKGECDQRKIDLNYYVFCKKYSRLFERFYDHRLTYSESYEDPPYNTIYKQDNRRFLTEKEFISEIYHV